MPLGQNQPISAIATGIDPHTTAQGVKIDEISMMVVAIAAQNGQIELRGEDSRASGTRLDDRRDQSSRRSTRNPIATGSSSEFAHSGLGLR